MYLMRQQADGNPGRAERLPYTGGDQGGAGARPQRRRTQRPAPRELGSCQSFRFRLQQADGQFGPEVHLPLSSIRSYWADDLDGDGRTEVVTIAAKSGQCGVQLAKHAAETLVGDQLDGQFSVLPLTRTDKPRRGVVWADVNGDGLSDLVAGDPGAGR